MYKRFHLGLSLIHTHTRGHQHRSFQNIHVNNYKINYVDQVKYLSAALDLMLNFKRHIKKMGNTLKCNSYLSAISSLTSLRKTIHVPEYYHILLYKLFLSPAGPR